MAACFTAGHQIVVVAQYPEGTCTCETVGMDFHDENCDWAGRERYVTKNIEDIQIGDIVLAKDQNNPDGPLMECVVVNTFIRYDKEVTTITLTDLNSLSTLEITGTAEHPFYVLGKGFVNLGDLELGDICVAPDGTHFEVTNIVLQEERQTVYNFEVAGAHTYYVGSGLDTAILVHNTCSSPSAVVGTESHEISKEIKNQLDAYNQSLKDKRKIRKEVYAMVIFSHKQNKGGHVWLGAVGIDPDGQIMEKYKGYEPYLLATRGRVTDHINAKFEVARIIYISKPQFEKLLEEMDKNVLEGWYDVNNKNCVTWSNMIRENSGIDHKMILDLNELIAVEALKGQGIKSGVIKDHPFIIQADSLNYQNNPQLNVGVFAPPQTIKPK